MRKWLFIFLISLLLLLLIQPAYGQGVRVKEISIHKIVPLNREYPLFECSNYSNMGISQASETLTFRFNTTNRHNVSESLRNNSKVVEPSDEYSYDEYNYISFEIQNYPDYLIYLYPDLLVIEYNCPIDTWIGTNDVIWAERYNINQVFIENFATTRWYGECGGLPLLPPLNGICALDKDSHEKSTTIILVGDTSPEVNSTNLDSYKNLLLVKDSKFVKVSDNEFIIYDETIASGERTINEIVFLSPMLSIRSFRQPIELNTVIFPVAEMQIDEANKGIEDSIRELRNIETEIVASRSKDSVDRCVEKLKSCDANKTKWDNISKDLTKLDQKLEEVLQIENYYVEPYKEYINNKNNLLSRDIEHLNERVTYFDDERGRILGIAESRRSTLIMEYLMIAGIVVSIFIAIGSSYWTSIQSSKSSKTQTKKLEDINSNLSEINKNQTKTLEDINSNLGEIKEDINSNLSEINNNLKKLLKPKDKRKSK